MLTAPAVQGEVEATGAPRDDSRVNLRRNELLVFVLAVGLAWTGAGVAVKRLTSRSGEGGLPGTPNPRALATIPAGTSPRWIAAGAGFVWAVVAEGLARIDPASHEVTPVDPAPEALLLAAPTTVAVAGCALWEAHAFLREIGTPATPVVLRPARAQELEPTGEWSVVRMDPDTGAIQVQARFREGFPNAIGVTGDAVWITSGDEDTRRGAITRLNPVSAKVVATIPIRANARDVALTPGGVWVSAGGAGDDANTVLRIDPRTNRIAARIELQTPPGRLAAGGGSVWVATMLNGGRIMRIDPSVDRVAGEVPILDPDGIAFGLGRVWVTRSDSGRMAWIDPTTLRVAESVRLARYTGALAVEEDGTAWVADVERDRIVRVDLFGRQSLRSPRPKRQACPTGTPVAAGRKI
jgi:DNA-binding beta-propeller fold protein YncE